MLIDIHITAEVDKTSGAFRSREAVGEAIIEEVAEPTTLYVEDSEYEVVQWDVVVGVGK